MSAEATTGHTLAPGEIGAVRHIIVTHSEILLAFMLSSQYSAISVARKLQGKYRLERHYVNRVGFYFNEGE